MKQDQGRELGFTQQAERSCVFEECFEIRLGHREIGIFPVAFGVALVQPFLTMLPLLFGNGNVYCVQLSVRSL